MDCAQTPLEPLSEPADQLCCGLAEGEAKGTRKAIEQPAAAHRCWLLLCILFNHCLILTGCEEVDHPGWMANQVLLSLALLLALISYPQNGFQAVYQDER